MRVRFTLIGNDIACSYVHSNVSVGSASHPLQLHLVRWHSITRARTYAEPRVEASNDFGFMAVHSRMMKVKKPIRFFAQSLSIRRFLAAYMVFRKACEVIVGDLRNRFKQLFRKRV